MHWSIFWDYRALLWAGLKLTLLLSSVSILGSLVLGTALGCLGNAPSGFLRRLLSLYIEVLRNLPIVVEIFVLYFAVGLDALPAGFIALIIHQSAYIADVVGSGFRTIPKEQVESAVTSGLSPIQIARYVTLPQVLRIVVPPLTSQFIEVVKNSSVVMMIGLPELTYASQDIASETFRGFEASSAVTVAYVLIALALSGGITLLHRRLTVVPRTAAM
jgi:polar amino acid transport system permease protein